MWRKRKHNTLPSTRSWSKIKCKKKTGKKASVDEAPEYRLPTVEESLKIVAENPRLLTQPFKWSCLLTSSQPKATVPTVARAVMDMLDGKTVGISREVPFAVAKSITEALAEEAKATYRAGPTKLPGFDDT